MVPFLDLLRDKLIYLLLLEEFVGGNPRQDGLFIFLLFKGFGLVEFLDSDVVGHNDHLLIQLVPLHQLLEPGGE